MGVFSKANYRYIKLKKKHAFEIWIGTSFATIKDFIKYHYLLIWSHYSASFTFYKLPSDT
jgi:hypothetical protein